MGAWAAVIDFRYHIVSLIAVFLALALGLFLGSTTLQSTVTRNLHHQADAVTGENRKLEGQKSLLTGQLKAEHAFTTAAEAYAVRGELTGDTVAVVSAPGVSSDDRKKLETTLQAAGASVSADVQLQPAYLDPTQDGELGALATELNLPGHALPAGNGSTEVSTELADALLTRPGHRAVSRGHAQQTLSALADGKFIAVSGSVPTHPASLAVMLVSAPSGSVSAKTVQAQNTVLLGLARDLRSSSSGTVIAGPTPAAATTPGTLAAARGDGVLTTTISTVDLGPTDLSPAPDPTAGRIAIVLALAENSTGVAGAYGLGQASPLPVTSTSP
jgi:hypothetical protein